MKKRILALITAFVTGATMMVAFTGCDGDSSRKETKSDDQDYGGYSKEYWDTARDAWDANT